jgi:hypothetical protein
MVAISRTSLSQERLREVLEYNPRTGDFTWVSCAWNKQFRLGKKAGYCCGGNYWVIKVDNQCYFAHRLAWLYMKGEWPIEIDHKNGIKVDNRWKNLREADQSQNQANRGKPRAGRQLKGVKLTQYGKYEASVTVKNRYIYLGVFSSEEAAHLAYCRAHKYYFGEYSWHQKQ